MSMRGRFFAVTSNLEHLNLLTSTRAIRHYHRLRQNHLRLQIRQLEALFDEVQVSEVPVNHDANDLLVFVGAHIDPRVYPVLNPPRRAITI